MYDLLDDGPYSDQNLNHNKLHSCIIELTEKHLYHKLDSIDKNIKGIHE